MRMRSERWDLAAAWFSGGGFCLVCVLAVGDYSGKSFSAVRLYGVG